MLPVVKFQIVQQVGGFIVVLVKIAIPTNIPVTQNDGPTSLI